MEWLRRGVLDYDGERMILAAQDQGLYTNGLKKAIGLIQSDSCRFCHDGVESPSHILSACKVQLGEGRYTTRHNKVCRILHWRLCHHYGLPAGDVSWKHEPPPFLENHQVRITYDRSIPVARHITDGALRPDLVIVDKESNSALIVDVSVPSDYGISRQEREKVIKYQDLKNDMKDTYNLTTVEVIPIILGATGVLKTNFNNYLSKLPCEVTPLELQKEVLRESISILKRALGCNLVA